MGSVMNPMWPWRYAALVESLGALWDLSNAAQSAHRRRAGRRDFSQGNFPSAFTQDTM